MTNEPIGAIDTGDEGALRQKAREAIEARSLPHRPPARTWGGRGVGACCSVCGEPVKQDQIEFELEFANDGSDSDRGRYRFHMRCFAAWEFERQNLEVAGQTTSANGHMSAPAMGGAMPQPGLRMAASAFDLPETGGVGTLCGCERDTQERERSA